MDSIHVHIGQCGIQLGNTYWSNMNVVDSTTLPCVAVDSEIKPAANLKRCLCGLMGGDNIILDRKGYGNWSCGYGSPLVGQVLERVRRVAEAIGSFNGVILTHSYAGGTGSGLTSKLLELLREQYPMQCIMCVSVTPFAGDSPLQHYNTLLTLQQQQLYSDLVILLHNESYYCSIKNNQDSVSMEDINSLMSSCLINFTKPLHDKKPILHRRGIGVSQLTTTLAPSAQYKLASTTHAIIDTLSWQQGLAKAIPTFLPSSTKMLHMLQIARGNAHDIKCLMQDVCIIDRRLQQLYRPVAWNPLPIEHWYGLEPTTTKLLSLLINSNTVTNMLCNVSKQSKMMYETKAYVHWYQKYGCEHDQFVSAFDTLSTIIDSYNSV